MTLIIYTLVMAHFIGYRDRYIKILSTWGITVIVKVIVRQMNKDHATMVGVGGGFMTLQQFLILLQDMTKRGFDPTSNAGPNGVSGSFGDGIVADVWDKILASLKENLTLHD